MNPLGEVQLLEPSFQPEALLAAGDLLSAGVVFVDTSLRVTAWNQWLADASGLEPDAVIGRSLLEIFPEMAGAFGETAFRRAIAGETVVLAHRFHQNLIPLRSDPAYSEVGLMQQSARISPLFRDRVVVGAIALIEDVTERVTREEDLRKAVEAAQAASKAKSEFIAAMSHELRTPLSAIIGYADILVTEIAGPLSTGQKEHVQRVKTGAWHLMGIIEEILTFSRAEAGREELHLEEIPPAMVAEEALSLVRPQALAKGLELLTVVDDLPDTIHTDRGKLRQILVNLLGNAVKFTEGGRVELKAFRDADSVCFAIRDTGPGIPAEEVERIFEPFTQVDYSLTRVKGGTGLGLAVSRRLATLLGGTLSVESTLGRGSLFTITVPLTLPEEPAFTLDLRIRPGDD